MFVVDRSMSKRDKIEIVVSLFSINYLLAYFKLVVFLSNGLHHINVKINTGVLHIQTLYVKGHGQKVTNKKKK